MPDQDLAEAVDRGELRNHVDALDADLANRPSSPPSHLREAIDFLTRLTDEFEGKMAGLLRGAGAQPATVSTDTAPPEVASPGAGVEPTTMTGPASPAAPSSGPLTPTA